MKKFKKGDSVECIERSNCGFPGEVGEMYEVESHDIRGLKFIGLKTFGMESRRFKITTKRRFTKFNFEVGDQLRCIQAGDVVGLCNTVGKIITVTKKYTSGFLVEEYEGYHDLSRFELVKEDKPTKFKVGDIVKCIKPGRESNLCNKIGETAEITKILDNGFDLKGYVGWHDPSRFELSTKKREFKPGDWVKCIKANPHSNLTIVGINYQIESITDNIWLRLVGSKHSGKEYLRSRFELSTIPKELVYDPNKVHDDYHLGQREPKSGNGDSDRFKVGDKVVCIKNADVVWCEDQYGKTFTITEIPNSTTIVFGSGQRYKAERFELPTSVKLISDPWNSGHTDITLRPSSPQFNPTTGEYFLSSRDNSNLTRKRKSKVMTSSIEPKSLSL